MITVALGKGRLAKKAMECFERIGISCDEMKEPDTRKLIFENNEKGYRFFLAKSPDVPTYVEYGAADIGIVGEDTILEEGRTVHEVLDLHFGKCRICWINLSTCLSRLSRMLKGFFHRSSNTPSVMSL